jgi:murein DD-endopeptidase MepM/ murein hydrolase activator NlpD
MTPLVLAFALAATTAPPPSLRIAPGTVFVEEWPERRDLNFEILIDNAGGPARELAAIELTAYDAQGRVQLRRLLDGNGVRPSIRTLPDRDVPANGALTVFNPFASFSRAQSLSKLHYELRFEGPEGTPETRATIDVAPRVSAPAAGAALPLRGPVLNYDGHDFYAHHRRFDTSFAPIAQLGFRGNFMRYAYDFVPVDAQGEAHRGDVTQNAQWIGFGADVLASADGVVVATQGAQPDDRHFDQGKLATQPWVLFGNYVLLDYGQGRFGVYAHLQQGSVRPKVGDRVHRGEAIARIGASGSAMFPHLHYQVQDGPTLQGEGLPSYFDDIRAVGAGAQGVLRSVDTGEIVRGD